MKQELIDLLSGAALSARTYLLDNLPNHTVYERKPPKESGKINPVTAHDKKAEEITIEYLRANKPDELKLAYDTEEFEHPAEIGANATVYVDPIDGTRGFIKGTWISSYSIALKTGEQLYGVVDDFTRRMMFVGSPNGAYATFENAKGEKTTKQLPAFQTFAFDEPRIVTDNLAFAKELYPGLAQKCFQEIDGSVALNLAHLAYGTFDALILNAKQMGAYDVAGGVAIVRGAGGTVRNQQGLEYNIDKPAEGIVAYMPWNKPKIN